MLNPLTKMAVLLLLSQVIATFATLARAVWNPRVREFADNGIMMILEDNVESKLSMKSIDQLSRLARESSWRWMLKTLKRDLRQTR